MDFQLKLNDPRLGHYDEEGALVRPSQMIDGRPYEANYASLFYVDYAGARYVVAIPVWFVEGFSVTIVGSEPKPIKAVVKVSKAAVKGDDVVKAEDD